MDITFADFLRLWRAKRHLSQLQLAHEAEVSARHISFLESGRSKPSKAMVLRLAQCLRIPRLETNQAFLVAGFAPVFQQHASDHRDVSQINQAVQAILENHLPLPALVLDRYWNITAANSAARRLMHDSGLAGKGDLINTLISDVALQVISNWAEASLLLLQRLNQEYLESGGDAQLARLVEKLRRRIDQTVSNPPPEINFSQAVLPTRFSFGDHNLSLFSAIAQFGSVFDTRLGDIRIELMFPLDKETRSYFSS